MGMVLTLLVVCEEKEYESALKAAMESGREHPARILLIVTATGRTASLDAELRIGEGTPGEVVVLRMRGPLAAHPASVVRPLLLPDSPVVIWWPGKAPAQGVNDELASLSDPAGHRRGRLQAAEGRAAGPGPGLPARRHRPVLDPVDPVAGPARRRPGPVPGADHAAPPSRVSGTARRPICWPPGCSPA